MYISYMTSLIRQDSKGRRAWLAQGLIGGGWSQKCLKTGSWLWGFGEQPMPALKSGWPKLSIPTGKPQPTGMLGITFWQDQNPRTSLCISELRATPRPRLVTHWVSVTYEVFLWLRFWGGGGCQVLFGLFVVVVGGSSYLSRNILTCRKTLKNIKKGIAHNLFSVIIRLSRDGLSFLT